MYHGVVALCMVHNADCHEKTQKRDTQWKKHPTTIANREHKCQ